MEKPNRPILKLNLNLETKPIEPKQYKMSKEDYTKLSDSINLKIIKFLQNLGYKPRKQIDESIGGVFLANWLFGAVLWDIYDGTQKPKEVVDLFVKKLNLKVEYNATKGTRYFFDNTFLHSHPFFRRIKSCMRGIDKARAEEPAEPSALAKDVASKLIRTSTLKALGINLHTSPTRTFFTPLRVKQGHYDLEAMVKALSKDKSRQKYWLPLFNKASHEDRELLIQVGLLPRT